MGILAALFFIGLLWNDGGGAEPAVVVAALLAALFAFWYVWPFYPLVGATFVLAGLLVASSALLVRPYWRGVDVVLVGAVALALLVAWDDALSHSFGLWTPLDWLFNEYIVEVLR